MASQYDNPPLLWHGGSSENYNPTARRELPSEYQPQGYRGGAGGFVPDANDQPGEDLMSTLTALLRGAAIGPMANTDPSDPRITAIQKYMEMQGSGQVPQPSTQIIGPSGFRGRSLSTRDMTPQELEAMVVDMNPIR